jgi:hypothetical protein
VYRHVLILQKHVEGKAYTNVRSMPNSQPGWFPCLCRLGRQHASKAPTSWGRGGRLFRNSRHYSPRKGAETPLPERRSQTSRNGPSQGLRVSEGCHWKGCPGKVPSKAGDSFGGIPNHHQESARKGPASSGAGPTGNLTIQLFITKTLTYLLLKYLVRSHFF